jgi:hypothetical protein
MGTKGLARITQTGIVPLVGDEGITQSEKQLEALVVLEPGEECGQGASAPA